MDGKDDFMKSIFICTINGHTYVIRRIIETYSLWKDNLVIATISRYEYDNWEGHQVKFKPTFSPEKLNYLEEEEDSLALEEAITYLNKFFGK